MSAGRRLSGRPGGAASPPERLQALVAGWPAPVIFLPLDDQTVGQHVRVGSEALELGGDTQLVIDGEMNALPLRAVAEGGVIDFDGACHGGVGGKEV